MNDSRMNSESIKKWADAIRAGSRRDLARAITLVESTRNEDTDNAQYLLEELIPYSGSSDRIGISGLPGAGKSTIIETLGRHLIHGGHKVAVLAIDPSSPKTGGSILGDKTRMERFSTLEAAFVRPSPAGQTLGGVSRKTRESMLLCEAAGYDIVLIETTGVGQAEWHVSNMVDYFVVLMLSNAGDFLQGMKRGILELADAILVNKADGGMKQSAEQAVSEYKEAVRLMRGEEAGVLVRKCSGIDEESVQSIWRNISEEIAARKGDERRDERRMKQIRQWIRSIGEDTIWQIMNRETVKAGKLDDLAKGVWKGKLTPFQAGQTYQNKLIDVLVKHVKHK